MGRSDRRPLVLDASALIAIDRGDARVGAVVKRVAESELPILVPAGVLAEVWRDGARQARIARLIASDDVSVRPLDEILAKAAGELCGRTRTDDVIDATVVLEARRSAGVVLTSDAADLLRLDPTLDIESV